MNNSFSLVYRLVEDSQLVQVVQKLEGNQLLKLIEYVGVEDSGDIISIATSKQLHQIFDDVFWKNTSPGETEKFDPEEFALWVEILHEHSHDAAVKFIIDMDDDLLTLGLAENLLVVDYESLLVRMRNPARSFEDDLLEKVLDSDLLLEWGDVLIISKHPRSWDALVAVLVELDSDDTERVHRILQTINHISTEYIEDNGGLYNVLNSQEMLETDLASNREERRGQRGYVSPETALAFLKLAQNSSVEEILSSPEEDYLTRSYFKAFRQYGNTPGMNESGKEKLMLSLSKYFPEMYQQLLDSEVIAMDSPILLPAEYSRKLPDSIIPLALQELQGRNIERFNRCLQELNYLANVLIAGDSNNGNRLRPIEAVDKVMETCLVGLRHILPPELETDLESVIEKMNKESLVKFFRIGWHLI